MRRDYEAVYTSKQIYPKGQALRDLIHLSGSKAAGRPKLPLIKYIQKERKLLGNNSLYYLTTKLSFSLSLSSKTLVSC